MIRRGGVFCSLVETLEHVFVQRPRLAAQFELLKGMFSGSMQSVVVDFQLQILCKKIPQKTCAYTDELHLWFCQVDRLADAQEPGSEHRQCGTGAGSEGAVEGPPESGTL